MMFERYRLRRLGWSDICSVSSYSSYIGRLRTRNLLLDGRVISRMVSNLRRGAPVLCQQ